MKGCTFVHAWGLVSCATYRDQERCGSGGQLPFWWLVERFSGNLQVLFIFGCVLVCVCVTRGVVEVVHGFWGMSRMTRLIDWLIRFSVRLILESGCHSVYIMYVGNLFAQTTRDSWDVSTACTACTAYLYVCNIRTFQVVVQPWFNSTWKCFAHDESGTRGF